MCQTAGECEFVWVIVLPEIINYNLITYYIYALFDRHTLYFVYIDIYLLKRIATSLLQMEQ